MFLATRIGVMIKKLMASWDISSATYASKSFSVVAQQSNPFGVFFSPDGVYMYVMGYSPYNIHQYVLSTPYAVNTASYYTLSPTWSYAAFGGGFPLYLWFKPDGTKLYIKSYNRTVHQLSLSTPWLVSSASFDGVSLSTASQETTDGINPICFSADGTKLYSAKSTGSSVVYQYNLSTAWNLATATYASKSLTVSTQTTNPFGLFVSADGSKLYVGDGGVARIWQYTLSTPFDLATASYASKVKDYSAQAGGDAGIFLTADGFKMYFMTTGGAIYQYDMGAL